MCTYAHFCLRTMFLKTIVFFFTILITVNGWPLETQSDKENINSQNKNPSSNEIPDESKGYLQYFGDTVKEYAGKVTSLWGDKSDSQEEHRVGLSKESESVNQSKGFLQSIGDTVKGYIAKKAKDMFKNIPMECDSEMNESGKLIPTEEGKEFCKSRCQEVYSKMNFVKEAVDSLKRYTPLGNDLKLEPRNNPKLSKYKCLPNLTDSKLLCDCPQAPQFSFEGDLKKYFDKRFAESPNSKLRSYGYGYGPQYYGYQGGYGSGYGSSGSGIFSMFLSPLKWLLYIILAIFVGEEVLDWLD